MARNFKPKTFPQLPDAEVIEAARALAREEGYRIVRADVAADRTHVACRLVSLGEEPRGLVSFPATYSADRLNPRLAQKRRQE